MDKFLHHIETTRNHRVLAFTAESSETRVSEGWCGLWISQPSTVALVGYKCSKALWHVLVEQPLAALGLGR